MIRTMRTLFLLFTVVGVLALAACSSGGDDGRKSEALAAAAAPAEPAFAQSEGAFHPEPSPPLGMPVAPAVAPAPMMATVIPAAAALASEEFDVGMQEDVALVVQERIIVRTVEMGLVVDDVSATIDGVATLTDELGGWVVSSDRSRKHRGAVSFRIPSDRLDDAVSRLRGLATEIDFEVVTSRDVTDEYVDTNARLRNLEATENALLKLLDRANKVEDALEVQRELTRVQEEVERLQGRIKFLEQTSAFSLINLDLRLAPADMSVDSGPDLTFSVGQVARFRATFKPPEGIEDFRFTWDFGDGSPPLASDRTAPTPDDDTRVTATVNHVYADDRDSPFIVEIEITGTGDAGVAEGTDTLTATVSKVPTIEIFAGEPQTAEQGEEVDFVGSFTRPEGLNELTFSWDFGDGSPPVTGSLQQGVTQAIASHAYSDHRPFAYTATLTITAQSDAGEVEASDSVHVLVTEASRWVVSGWSAGDAGKRAVKVLSGVGQGLGTFFIWAGILSPLWFVGGGAVLFAKRRRRRSGTTPDAGADSE